MAKKQTRRTISLSRATYDAAMAAAAREGIAAAEWVTRLIRKACPELAEQLHASTPEGRSATAGQSRKKKRTGAEIIELARALSIMTADDVEAMLAANGRRETKPLNLITGDSFDRGDEACARTVAAATPEPPRSRLELDRMAAERKRTVKPGTFCANCIDRRATHRGRIDLSGVIYDLCDECELPKNEEREGWHEQRGTR